MNKCTKCKDDYILNNWSCSSCFSLNEGCEKCSKNGKCTKCYNNKNFKYEISNDKCVNKEEENKSANIINLIFERFDSYEQEDDKIHFKPHFILLDNYLYNTTLHITIIIQIKIINIQENVLRYLRSLEEIESKEKDIICDQYGDSLGNNNKGGYLANFKCTMNIEDDQELLSIEPTKMEIKDKNNNVIQSFETENKVLNVSALDKISLDEEYDNYIFNKISISDINEIVLKDNDLSFNIIGNIDSSIEKEKDYEILLKNNKNEQINATCHFPILDNLDSQTISCMTSIKKDSKTLSFIQGIYSSKVSNDDILILINNNELNIKVPEKKGGLSSGAIVGIVIAVIVVISIAVFLIIKFIIIKKKSNVVQKEPDNYKSTIKSTCNSKDFMSKKYIQ